jgi:mRNA interferase RelE/StbE
MTYTVLFTRQADKDLGRISPPDRTRIIRKAMRLAHDPRPKGVKKLIGEEDLYRIRIGDYRVVYEILDRIVTVTVVRIRHRRDAYKGL